MQIVDFDFDEEAPRFPEHIDASIRDLNGLRWWQENLSRHFVQPGTTVVDVGCSTGEQLARIASVNRSSRKDVTYLGVDKAKAFEPHWARWRGDDVHFVAQDALSFDFGGASLVLSTFTVQFIPERHKLALLGAFYGGLVEGGALIIAEKTLAASASVQQMIEFGHYDHKRQNFSAGEILDKERRLRGFMTPWTRSRLLLSLRSVGFAADEIDVFWQQGPFVAAIAIKRTGPRQPRSAPRPLDERWRRPPCLASKFFCLFAECGVKGSCRFPARANPGAGHNVLMNNNGA